MLIKELVTMDEYGAFRSDVQLSDYDNCELNLKLLGNYIFTTHAPATSRVQRDYATIDVLDTLKTAFTVVRAGSEFNRIVITANYGRGKSHLALVLANFFARPFDSKEFKQIMERVKHALSNNAPRLSSLIEFKQKKGEFLVIRLRGDYCDDLQAAFLQALEQALSEHLSTRGLKLPFWYAHAEAWLNSLTGEALKKAEDFLSTQKTDMPLLISQLRNQGYYDLVRETFKRVTGAYPDFGREINLKDLVLWAVDDVCVPNHLGGLLILFDEFSLFLQKYVGARTPGKLQELLNGVGDRPGKSAFLAFTQIDVDTVAETYTRGQRLEDVKKELERLPKDKRARLFSLMESVLASYLKQDETAWRNWEKQREVRGPLVLARETLYNYFSRRYNNMLQWNPETATETIVKGCFPLHPLTTAILSSHSFESGASENPRTALQFVRRMWENQREYPAQLENGKPNFVFATALVDFFDGQISQKWYEAYRNALEVSPIPLSEEHRSVLKALLLQQAVDELDRQKARKSEQLELLSQLSGLEEKRLKGLLRELSEHRVIRYDPYNKMSMLLLVGMRSLDAEKIIQAAAESVQTDLALEKIKKSIPTLDVSQEFGHANDWTPRQVVFTKDLYRVEQLKKLLLPYRAGIDGIEEAPRGLVIWLLAQSEDEKMSLRQSAQAVLDSALGDIAHPLPIVIVLPKKATPGLVESAQRLRALESLSQSDREKIGLLYYNQEKALTEQQFKNELEQFLGEPYEKIQRNLHEYSFPKVYWASIQTLNDRSIKAVVSECYRQAYAFRLKFYQRYPVGGRGQNKLRTAVRKVALGLLTDEIGGSLSTLGNRDIQHQLSTLYLVKKWGLLRVDSYIIQPPTLRVLLESWNLLEDTFPPGCADVRAKDVLLKLLNPPYGHDYNTLTLLLAAWIGYHRYEIRLSLAGKVFSLSEFRNIFDEAKKPQDFLNRLCVTSPLAISRLNKDEMFSEVNEILERVRQGSPFSISQASDALANLETAYDNPALPGAKREEIDSLRPRLEDALAKAKEYDRKVKAWLADFISADFDKLLEMRSILDKMPTLSLVLGKQPALNDLCQRWESKLEKELDLFCDRYSELKEISDYKSYESKLKQAQRALKEYPVLRQKVDHALSQLAQRHKELKQLESEKVVIAEINSMTPFAGLAVLYEYRDKLVRLKNLSPQTAKIRDGKTQQIENRIQQYEQIASELPKAVSRATTLSELRQQRDVLIANLNQVEETALYETLTTTLDKIQHLEKFFEQLRVLESLPCKTPNELVLVQTQIVDLQSQFSKFLSPRQLSLLEKKKADVDKIRQQKIREAQRWLTHLKKLYKNGENPEVLLQQLETPPAFLDEPERKQVEKLLQDNIIYQIEALFLKLDSDIRQTCLQRLQELMDTK